MRLRPIAAALRTLLALLLPFEAAAWDAARAPHYPDADFRTLEANRVVIHGSGSTGDGSRLTVTLPDGTTTSVAQALAARQPLDASLSLLGSIGAPLLRGTGSGYQVQPDRTIQGPDGRRFIVKGVTFLDYLFVSLETRSDYRYRAVPGIAVTGGGSTQSGFEPSVWGKPDGSDVRARITDWAAAGVNLLRVAVEPAVAYTAAANGYPSHWQMMDVIVSEANRLGLVVQWQSANDRAPADLNAAFLAQLRDRYWTARNVWINTGNELGCAAGGPACTDVATWNVKQTQYLQAVRGDVTGQPAGTRFTGPVVLNAPNYGEAVDTVAALLANGAVYAKDPNLILGVHTYRIGEATFGARLRALQQAWVDAIGTVALFIDETGPSNDGTLRDPSLDPKADPALYPVSPAATLATAYDWTADLLAWARRLSRETAFSGVTFFSGSAYIPGLGIHDPNSLKRRDGTWTPFGRIARDGWFSASADGTSFAGRPFVTLLYDADMSLNARGFAGGAAANGTGTYDGWISLDGATSLTRGSDGTITLAGGYLRQTVRGRGAEIAGSAIVTSFGDLTGSVEVGIDWPGSAGPALVQVNAAHGRGRGGVVTLPASVAGDITVTLHPLGGPITFRDVQVEGGYRPTQLDRRPPAIERAHVQRLADPAGAYLVAGTLIAAAANTLTFAVPYPVPMQAIPASATFAGTADADYGIAVSGQGQAGWTFAIQNPGAAGLQVLATKPNHGLTAAQLPAFYTAAGGILVSAE